MPESPEPEVPVTEAQAPTCAASSSSRAVSFADRHPDSPPRMDLKAARSTFETWVTGNLSPEDVQNVCRAVDVIHHEEEQPCDYFAPYLSMLRDRCYKVYKRITDCNVCFAPYPSMLRDRCYEVYKKITDCDVYEYFSYCFPIAMQSIAEHAKQGKYGNRQIAADDVRWMEKASSYLRNADLCEHFFSVVLEAIRGYQGKVIVDILQSSCDGNSLLEQSKEEFCSVCRDMAKAVKNVDDAFFALEVMLEQLNEANHTEAIEALLGKLVFVISTVDEAVAALDFLSKYIQRRNDDVMLDCEQIINIVPASEEDRRLAEIVHGFFVAALEQLIKLNAGAEKMAKWFDAIVSFGEEFSDPELLRLTIQRLAESKRLTEPMINSVKNPNIRQVISEVVEEQKCVYAVRDASDPKELEPYGQLPSNAEVEALVKFWMYATYATKYVQEYGLQAETFNALVGILSHVPEEKREKLQNLLLLAMKKNPNFRQYIMRTDLRLSRYFFSEAFCLHVKGYKFFKKYRALWRPLCENYGAGFLRRYRGRYGFTNKQYRALIEAGVPKALLLQPEI